MMKHHACILGLAAALLGASGTPKFERAMGARIDSIVRAALARQHVAAASVAVAERGRVVYAKGYGLRDLDDGLPADAKTIYHIGSISKQFTAAAIVRLAEQGRLNVDDRLSKYLPDAPHASEVTLRNLLTHTSGIIGYTELPEFADLLRNPATPARVVALVAGKPLVFAPGTSWQYSNTNFILLGLVVEKVSGEPYERFIEANFLRPLGLRSATFWDRESIVTDNAQGYTSYALGPIYHADFWDNDWAWAAGGLAMNAIDLARWDVALDSGAVVSPGSFAEMTTPQKLASGTPTSYGFGLAIGTFAGHRVVAHSGAISGFITDSWTVPADGLAIVLLGNGDNFSPVPVIHDIAATLYGIPVPPRPVSVVAQAPADAQRAKELMMRALGGDLDDALVDTTMQQALTAKVRQDLTTLGKRLGSPLAADLVFVDDRPPVTTYRYRVRFADETLEYDLALTSSGKIDGLNFAPWYAY